MEMKLLSYILSRLEIYFITCIYRTSVCVLRACVNARVECEPVRESESVRVHAVRGEFVRWCCVHVGCVCVWRKAGEKKVRRRYETPKRRDVERRNNFLGKKCASWINTRQWGKSSEKEIRQAVLRASHLPHFTSQLASVGRVFGNDEIDFVGINMKF